MRKKLEKTIVVYSTLDINVDVDNRGWRELNSTYNAVKYIKGTNQNAGNPGCTLFTPRGYEEVLKNPVFQHHLKQKDFFVAEVEREKLDYYMKEEGIHKIMKEQGIEFQKWYEFKPTPVKVPHDSNSPHDNVDPILEVA